MPAARPTVSSVKSPLAATKAASDQASSLTTKTPSPSQNGSIQVKEVRTLLEWKSSSRPFKRRETEYYKTLGAVLFLVCVILLFVKEWLLIAAIGAFYFITYVLGRFPPEEVEHKITTQGVTSGGRVYLWRELSDFWFTQVHEQTVLNVDVYPTGKLSLSGRLFILLGDQMEAKAKDILAKYLPFREIPEKSLTDDIANWMAKKIPLEKS